MSTLVLKKKNEWSGARPRTNSQFSFLFFLKIFLSPLISANIHVWCVNKICNEAAGNIVLRQVNPTYYINAILIILLLLCCHWNHRSGCSALVCISRGKEGSDLHVVTFYSHNHRLLTDATMNAAARWFVLWVHNTTCHVLVATHLHQTDRLSLLTHVTVI